MKKDYQDDVYHHGRYTDKDLDDYKYDQRPSKRSRPFSGGRPPGGDPRVLTSKMQQATDPQELNNLVLQHGGSLNFIHISTAFMRLSHMCKDSEAAQKPEVQHLLERLHDQLQAVLEQQAATRGLANIIWACGVLRYKAPVAACLDAFMGQLHTLESAIGISQVLYGCAKAGQHVSEQQVQQLLAVLTDSHLLCSASAQAVANTLWAVATMGQHPHAEQVALLLSAYISKLEQASAGDVANVLWATTTIGQGQPDQYAHQQQLLLDAFLDERLLYYALPRHIADVLWAAAVMGQCIPAPQLQQLLDALARGRQLSRARPQAISKSLWAIATMQQQCPEQQLQQLLAALLDKLPDFEEPQEISSVLWSVAMMGQRLSVDQLQELLAAFTSRQLLPQATPHHIADSLWAAAEMLLPVPGKALHKLLAAFTSKQLLPQATPEHIANVLWAVTTLDLQLPASAASSQLTDKQVLSLLTTYAGQPWQWVQQDVCAVLQACGRLRFVPSQLLAALERDALLLEDLLSSMPAQDLVNTAWACGVLGYKGPRLPGAILQRVLQQHQQAAAGCSSSSDSRSSSCCSMHGLVTLCWCAAVLDLQEHVDEVLQLAGACSQQWHELGGEGDLVQLFQVHLWLLDSRRQPESVGRGLLGGLNPQQLQQCRASWQASVAAEAAEAAAAAAAAVEAAEDGEHEPLLQSVLHALQQLSRSTWQQPPAVQACTADGAFNVHIAATTAAGVRVAFEVNGPGSYLRPDRAVDGPTLYRHRALAARGYHVYSIPYWEWEDREGRAEQVQYLLCLLQP